MRQLVAITATSRRSEGEKRNKNWKLSGPRAQAQTLRPFLRRKKLPTMSKLRNPNESHSKSWFASNLRTNQDIHHFTIIKLCFLHTPIKSHSSPFDLLTHCKADWKGFTRAGVDCKSVSFNGCFKTMRIMLIWHLLFILYQNFAKVRRAGGSFCFFLCLV